MGLEWRDAGCRGRRSRRHLQLAKPVGDLDAPSGWGRRLQLRWTGPVENTDKTKVKPGGKTSGVPEGFIEKGSCTAGGECGEPAGRGDDV